MILVDSHCHLDFSAFDNDRSEVIIRALQNDVKIIMVPAVELDSISSVLQLSEQYPGIYAAVGVHPNHASSWHQGWIQELNRYVSHPKVVAIGEIGLDYYRNVTSRNIQRAALEEQLSIAEKARKPVVLHNRDAFTDLMDILKNWVDGLDESQDELRKCPGVLHSFSGQVSDADRAIQMNFLIGITGPVTFSNAKSIQEVVTYTPLENLVIETDSPYLTPHPHRGKRNEPSFVKFVADKIAVLKNIPLEEVARQTSTNAQRLLHWREIFD